MSKRRNILLIMGFGLLALTVALFLLVQHHESESAARQKLDTLLGQADETLPDQTDPFVPYPKTHPNSQAPANPQIGSSPAPQSQGFLGLPIPNPMESMPDSGVNVQESPTEYVLRIPLVNPADAKNVKVDVSPHRIEVSGKVGRQEQGVSFTSSFMQSFSTSQVVLPDKMTQKTVKVGDKTELVITIPKKPGGQPNLNPPPAPEAPLAPQAPDESLPDDNSTPSGEHRVI